MSNVQMKIDAVKKKYHGFYNDKLIIAAKPKKDEEGNITGWKVELSKCVANYAIILENVICPGKLSLNTFDGNEYIEDDVLQNHHYIDLQVALERFIDDSVDIRAVKSACTYVARLNKYNPFVKIFEELPVSDTHYLDNWLTLIFGVEDTPLNRTYGRKWMMAAVARALEDLDVYVEGSLIFFGKQADWKTWFFKNINLRPEYYCGSKVDLTDTRRASLTYAGSHICELGELTQFAKMEEEDIKQFLTQTSDKFDKKFENQAVSVRRRFIFGGSTNRNDFLKDHTGSRRFWVVKVEKFDMELFRNIKNALWYEAYQAYLKSDRNQPLDPWVLTEEERVCNKEQNQKFQYTDIVVSYLHDYIYDINLDAEIRASKFNDYLKEKGMQHTEKRVSEVLQNVFGWGKEAKRDGVYYIRPQGDTKTNSVKSTLSFDDVSRIEAQIEAYKLNGEHQDEEAN